MTPLEDEVSTFFGGSDLTGKAEEVVETIIANLDERIAQGRPDDIDPERWERFLYMRDKVVPLLRSDPKWGVMVTAEFLRERGFLA